MPGCARCKLSNLVIFPPVWLWAPNAASVRAQLPVVIWHPRSVRVELSKWVAPDRCGRKLSAPEMPICIPTRRSDEGKIEYLTNVCKTEQHEDRGGETMAHRELLIQQSLLGSLGFKATRQRRLWRAKAPELARSYWSGT
jgi:hypothetical protein